MKAEKQVILGVFDDNNDIVPNEKDIEKKLETKSSSENVIMIYSDDEEVIQFVPKRKIKLKRPKREKRYGQKLAINEKKWYIINGCLISGVGKYS